MRWLVAVLLALALAGGIWAWLEADGPTARGPRPEQEPAPAPAVPEEPRAPEAATGTLVIRVVAPEGSVLPPETQAGYFRFGSRRMRRAAADGTFPFSDAPLGPIDATAEAPGFSAETVHVVVVPGVPTEIVVPLTAVR